MPGPNPQGPPPPIDPPDPEDAKDAPDVGSEDVAAMVQALIDRAREQELLRAEDPETWREQTEARRNAIRTGFDLDTAEEQRVNDPFRPGDPGPPGFGKQDRPDPFAVHRAGAPWERWAPFGAPSYKGAPPSGLVEHRLDDGTRYTCLRCGWEHRFWMSPAPTAEDVQALQRAHEAECPADNPHVIRSGPLEDYAAPMAGLIAALDRAEEERDRWRSFALFAILGWVAAILVGVAYLAVRIAWGG